jgi:hypothetical protein
VSNSEPEPESQATPTPRDGEADKSNVLETVSKLVGFAVGLTAFVYVAGGTVLWIRLFRSDLPADPVITSLPRELVIGIGLKSVVAPAAALAILAWVALRGVTWSIRTSGTRRTHGTLFLAVGAISFLAAFWLVPRLSWAIGGLIAAMVVYFIALLIGWVRKRFQPVRDWGNSEFALAAVVIGLGGAFIRVALEVADPRLDNAVVCVGDGSEPYTGLLVGEAKDAVYLGERSERVVIAIPKSRVEELWIGTDDHACGPISKPR